MNVGIPSSLLVQEVNIAPKTTVQSNITNAAAAKFFIVLMIFVFFIVILFLLFSLEGTSGNMGFGKFYLKNYVRDGDSNSADNPLV